MSDRLGFMNFSMFEKLVDEFNGGVRKVCLSGRGEPTLHPNIVEMIQLLKSKGVSTFMNTNALKLSDPRLVEEIVKTGLDSIYISLDGVNQDTYGTIRVGGEVKSVLSSLEHLTTAKRALGVDKPYVQVNFLYSKINQQDLPAIVRLSEKFDIDRIRVNGISIPGGIFRNNPQLFREMVDRFVPENAPKRYEGYSLVRPHKRCGEFKRATIVYDGRMLVCQRDAAKDMIIGNVFDQGLWPVWKNRVKISKKAIKGKSFKECDGCPQSLAYHGETVYEKRK